MGDVRDDIDQVEVLQQQSAAKLPPDSLRRVRVPNRTSWCRQLAQDTVFFFNSPLARV